MHLSHSLSFSLPKTLIRTLSLSLAFSFFSLSLFLSFCAFLYQDFFSNADEVVTEFNSSHSLTWKWKVGEAGFRTNESSSKEAQSKTAANVNDDNVDNGDNDVNVDFHGTLIIFSILFIASMSAPLRLTTNDIGGGGDTQEEHHLLFLNKTRQSFFLLKPQRRNFFCLPDFFLVLHFGHFFS